MSLPLTLRNFIYTTTNNRSHLDRPISMRFLDILTLLYFPYLLHRAVSVLKLNRFNLFTILSRYLSWDLLHSLPPDWILPAHSVHSFPCPSSVRMLQASHFSPWNHLSRVDTFTGEAPYYEVWRVPSLLRAFPCLDCSRNLEPERINNIYSPTT